MGDNVIGVVRGVKLMSQHTLRRSKSSIQIKECKGIEKTKANIKHETLRQPRATCMCQFVKFACTVKPKPMAIFLQHQVKNISIIKGNNNKVNDQKGEG